MECIKTQSGSSVLPAPKRVMTLRMYFRSSLFNCFKDAVGS